VREYGVEGLDEGDKEGEKEGEREVRSVPN